MERDAKKITSELVNYQKATRALEDNFSPPAQCFDRLAIRNLSFRSRVQMQPKRFKSNVLFSGKAFKIH